MVWGMKVFLSQAVTKLFTGAVNGANYCCDHLTDNLVGGNY